MARLTVHFWGTRGSIPTPGRKTEKYGGNTCCVELRAGDTMIVLDAGSGIRELGQAWSEEFTGRPVRATLLLTHLHWDHIQGFPFFVPAYQEENSLVIYGEERPSGGIRELLGGQMAGDYFPVPLSAMRSHPEFRNTSAEFAIDDLRVRTTKLPHPGGTLGYRVESDESVFVFATDCDLNQIARNARALEQDLTAARQYDAALLDFFRGAHMLVIDCQFLDGEYSTRRIWGHNSIATVVDLCMQVHPHMVALFHHDPQHTDDMVTRMAIETIDRLESRGIRDILVFAAREGVTMQVAKPRRPARVTG
jgi:phosphoribosyl 1,2-cyclic phosphodiesterase